VNETNNKAKNWLLVQELKTKRQAKKNLLAAFSHPESVLTANQRKISLPVSAYLAKCFKVLDEPMKAIYGAAAADILREWVLDASKEKLLKDLLFFLQTATPIAPAKKIKRLVSGRNKKKVHEHIYIRLMSTLASYEPVSDGGTLYDAAFWEEHYKRFKKRQRNAKHEIIPVIWTGLLKCNNFSDFNDLAYLIKNEADAKMVKILFPWLKKKIGSEAEFKNKLNEVNFTSIRRTKVAEILSPYMLQAPIVDSIIFPSIPCSVTA